MKKRSFGLVKVNFVMFVIFIGFFLCGKFGIPYIYEKYGMPVDAVVYEISNGTKGGSLAHYEFIVDQKKYRGNTYRNVHEGVFSIGCSSCSGCCLLPVRICPGLGISQVPDHRHAHSY